MFAYNGILMLPRKQAPNKALNTDGLGQRTFGASPKPIWDKVSTHDGGDAFLLQFAETTEPQKTLLASHWAQSEIMNGGLGQFFSNSTGVLAPEAAEGFEKLGMPNCERVVRLAMQFFGDPYPRDWRVRVGKFEDFQRGHGEDVIPLLELEDAIATEIENENGGFWDAANRYAEDR